MIVAKNNSEGLVASQRSIGEAIHTANNVSRLSTVDGNARRQQPSHYRPVGGMPEPEDTRKPIYRLLFEPCSHRTHGTSQAKASSPMNATDSAQCNDINKNNSSNNNSTAVCSPVKIQHYAEALEPAADHVTKEEEDTVSTDWVPSVISHSKSLADSHEVWRLFTKAKDALPNGQRLENLSWRLLHMKLSKQRSTSMNTTTTTNTTTSVSQRPIVKNNIFGLPIAQGSNVVSPLAKQSQFHQLQSPVEEPKSTMMSVETNTAWSADNNEIAARNQERVASEIVGNSSYNMFEGGQEDWLKQFIACDDIGNASSLLPASSDTLPTIMMKPMNDTSSINSLDASLSFEQMAEMPLWPQPLAKTDANPNVLLIAQHRQYQQFLQSKQRIQQPQSNASQLEASQSLSLNDSFDMLQRPTNNQKQRLDYGLTDFSAASNFMNPHFAQQGVKQHSMFNPYALRHDVQPRMDYVAPTGMTNHSQSMQIAASPTLFASTENYGIDFSQSVNIPLLQMSSSVHNPNIGFSQQSSAVSPALLFGTSYPPSRVSNAAAYPQELSVAPASIFTDTSGVSVAVEPLVLGDVRMELKPADNRRNGFKVPPARPARNYYGSRDSSALVRNPVKEQEEVVKAEAENISAVIPESEHPKKPLIISTNTLLVQEHEGPSPISSSSTSTPTTESQQVTVCTNCETTKTPLWRKDVNGMPLCNACGLFLKLHGVTRPISMKTDVIRKRNRSGRRDYEKLESRNGGAYVPTASAIQQSTGTNNAARSRSRNSSGAFIGSDAYYPIWGNGTRASKRASAHSVTGATVCGDEETNQLRDESGESAKERNLRHRLMKQHGNETKRHSYTLGDSSTAEGSLEQQYYQQDDERVDDDSTMNETNSSSNSTSLSMSCPDSFDVGRPNQPQSHPSPVRTSNNGYIKCGKRARPDTDDGIPYTSSASHFVMYHPTAVQSQLSFGLQQQRGNQ